MTGLETAFYIVGISFMGLALVVMIATLIAVIVIYYKLHHIAESLKGKLNIVAMATSAIGSAMHYAAPALRIMRQVSDVSRRLRK